MMSCSFCNDNFDVEGMKSSRVMLYDSWFLLSHDVKRNAFWITMTFRSRISSQWHKFWFWDRNEVLFSLETCNSTVFLSVELFFRSSFLLKFNEVRCTLLGVALPLETSALVFWLLVNILAKFGVWKCLYVFRHTLSKIWEEVFIRKSRFFSLWFRKLFVFLNILSRQCGLGQSFLKQSGRVQICRV